MKTKIITLSSLIIFMISTIAFAEQTAGHITGSIDGNQVDLEIRCEFADPPGLLNAKSDWGSFKQADTDGDGLYINATGMKITSTVAVVFHIGDQIYKFGHRGDIDKTGLLINDEFNRKDGSSYKVDLSLSCE